MDFNFQNWFSSITDFTRFRSRRFWISSIFQLWYPRINILWYFCIYIIHYETNNNNWNIKNGLWSNLVNLLIDHNSFSKLKSVKPNSFSFVRLFGLKFAFYSSTGAPLNEKRPFTDEDTAALYYNIWACGVEVLRNS